MSLNPTLTNEQEWPSGIWYGFDLETTGPDPRVDLPVQVAIVTIKKGEVGEINKFLVKPGIPVSQGARNVHQISDEDISLNGIELEDASSRIHSLLSQASLDKSPIVAMNASFDITIAQRMFDTFQLPTIEWQSVLDPLVLDRHFDKFRKGKRRLEDLCNHYGVTIGDFHDAGNDAIAALYLIGEIISKYPEIGCKDLAQIHTSQAVWHKEWAIGFDSWSKSRGSKGLSEVEFKWPVAI